MDSPSKEVTFFSRKRDLSPAELMNSLVVRSYKNSLVKEAGKAGGDGDKGEIDDSGKYNWNSFLALLKRHEGRQPRQERQERNETLNLHVK